MPVQPYAQLLLLTIAGALLAVCPAPASETTRREDFAPLVQLSAPLAPRALFRPGSFDMGSTPEEAVAAFARCAAEPLPQRCDVTEFQDEGPLRRITLSAFLLDRYEVSVEAYARCVAARRCSPIPFRLGARRFARAELPATFVRHEDAARFCRFRGGRLPTEAEFERAARGQTRRQFPWGDLYNSKLANHGQLAFDVTDASDGHAELAPVRSYPLGKTPEQIFNLAGNAAEWVRDRYLPEYLDTERLDPAGPQAGSGATTRVVRGGSFASAAPWLRGASRDGVNPDTRSAEIGFRCAYEPLSL